MSEVFYSRATLYDLMFPADGPAVDYYRAEAERQSGSVLELGCGTGHKLIPIASDGHPCVGLDSSPDMLAEAQRKADQRGVKVQWVKATCATSTWAAPSTSCSSQPTLCCICEPA